MIARELKTMPDGTSIDRQALHPKIARAFAYWRSIHPAPGVLPGRQHLDPMAIPDVLPGVWLLDVERAPLRRRSETKCCRIRRGGRTLRWISHEGKPGPSISGTSAPTSGQQCCDDAREL